MDCLLWLIKKIPTLYKFILLSENYRVHSGKNRALVLNCTSDTLSELSRLLLSGVRLSVCKLFFIFNFLFRTTESTSLNLAKGFQVYPNVFNTGTPQFTNLIKTSSVLLLMNPWLHRSVYNKISYLLSSVLIFHTFLHRCTLQS